MQRFMYLQRVVCSIIAVRPEDCMWDFFRNGGRMRTSFGIHDLPETKCLSAELLVDEYQCKT